MTIPAAFASIAQAFSAATGVGFHDALAKWPGTATYSGGSIVTPGTPVQKSCSAQVDIVTEDMRTAEGYTEKDMRILVLAATLDGDLDTNAEIEVLAGPHAGQWMIDMVDQDPCGIYWQCRGRKA